MNFKEYSDKIYEIAEKISDTNTVYKFLTESISKETLDRFLSIDWSNYREEYLKTVKYKFFTAAISNDPDLFITELNLILGNCCINDINDLDNV